MISLTLGANGNNIGLGLFILLTLSQRGLVFRAYKHKGFALRADSSGVTSVDDRLIGRH